MILRDIGLWFFTNKFPFSYCEKNSLADRRAILKISVEQIQGGIFNDVYIHFKKSVLNFAQFCGVFYKYINLGHHFSQKVLDNLNIL